MKIRVLGADGGVAPGKKTTSFLVNDNILFDAGSAASSLSIKRQENLKAIVVSHPHIDHIKDIPAIADNIIGFKKKPVEVISIPEIIEDIRAHIFNNVIWPDMSKIPPGAPVIKFRAVKEKFKIGNLTVKMYRVNHPCNAVGFILSDSHSTIVITGDTGPTDLLWEKANKEKKLKGLFTEIAFPIDQEDLANASGHFTPLTFRAEIAKLKKKVPVFIYHFKPRYVETLVKEVMEMNLEGLKILETEDEFFF